MYESIIKEFSPHHDPRLIEAFMRLQYGVLDHLSRDDFRREAPICQACVDADPAAALRLADTI